ncbi:MAG: hypothetical protein D6820_12420 [Lentisphaerae bacterium]|nr:MAG: hypothetical protein D6820_12420 [Lentisphaerota bacterium]
MAFLNGAEVVTKLKQQGVLEETMKISGFQRLLRIKPKFDCLVAFAVVFTLTLVVSLARLRHPKWPIHPVMFAVLGTYQSKKLAFSFFVGWMIKILIMRFGGSRAYQRLKPLMIGLIAGEMFCGLIPMIIGAIYYYITGHSPEPFRVF